MADEIDRSLRDLRRRVWKPVEAEAVRLKMTPPQRSVMQILFDSEGLSLKELSRQVGLSHSTVSGIVDRLVKKGLLERRSDPHDGRFARILVPHRIRKYGRAKMKALALNPLAVALQRAKPKDRKAISNGLRTLRRLLEKSTK
jgi:DNA-binding MarR family transcriptional regulator